MTKNGLSILRKLYAELLPAYAEHDPANESTDADESTFDSAKQPAVPDTAAKSFSGPTYKPESALNYLGAQRAGGK